MKIAAGICVALLLAGCTSVRVSPVAPTTRITHVCIVDNPKVKVADFVTVLRDGFDRHGIATSVVTASAASKCEITLTYTALRSWDFSAYLSRAELRLWRRGRQIGSADYHLRNKGGLSLAKWRGTKSKIDPVIDRLLNPVSDAHPTDEVGDAADDAADSQPDDSVASPDVVGTIGHGESVYVPPPMNRVYSPSSTDSGQDASFTPNTHGNSSTTITGRFTGKSVALAPSATGVKRFDCEYDTGQGRIVWHTVTGSCPGTWEGQ